MSDSLSGIIRKWANGHRLKVSRLGLGILSHAEPEIETGKDKLPRVRFLHVQTRIFATFEQTFHAAQISTLTKWRAVII